MAWSTRYRVALAFVTFSESQGTRRAPAARARPRSVGAANPIRLRLGWDQPCPGRAFIHHGQLLSATAVHGNRGDRASEGIYFSGEIRVRLSLIRTFPLALT